MLLPPDIQRLMQVWEFSVAAGDVPAMMYLCTDDIEVVVNGVRPVRGAEAVAGMLNVVFANQRMERRTQFRACHLDQKLAVLTADVFVNVQPSPDEDAVTVVLREVTVLRRVSHDWKVCFSMTNMLGPEDVP